MLHIKKKHTPPEVTAHLTELQESEAFQAIDPSDTKGLRAFFNSNAVNKNLVRETLSQDQHGLCAYCMSKLERQYYPFPIEHWSPLSKDKNGVLDYDNYLGVCDGGNHSGRSQRGVVCCDAAKGNREIKLNPQNEQHVNAIVYHENGQMEVLGNPELTKELDIVLKLNGELNSDRTLKYDTYTELVHRRSQAYKDCTTAFKRWRNAGTLSSSALDTEIRKIEMLLQSEEKVEALLGVRLYCYRKKLDSLLAQGK